MTGPLAPPPSQVAGLPARHILTAGFNAATAAALATAVNAWLAGTGAKMTLLDIQYRPTTATDHNALVLYTE